MNIWVNGCFDILHTGHIELLEYAKKYNQSKLFDRTNRLYVGIDSDERVKRLKGDKRPINEDVERGRMLQAIRWVDRVVVFSTDDEMRNYITSFDIDYIVVGDHYKDKPVIGEERAIHGVVYFPTDKRSSTDIIKKIQKEVYLEIYEENKDGETQISMAFNNFAVNKLRNL